MNIHLWISLLFFSSYSIAHHICHFPSNCFHLNGRRISRVFAPEGNQFKVNLSEKVLNFLHLPVILLLCKYGSNKFCVTHHGHERTQKNFFYIKCIEMYAKWILTMKECCKEDVARQNFESKVLNPNIFPVIPISILIIFKIIHLKDWTISYGCFQIKWKNTFNFVAMWYFKSSCFLLQAHINA